MINPWKYSLNYETIGSYKLGQLYSESFSGIPWEIDLNIPLNVGREDETIMNYAYRIDNEGNPKLREVPGGIQKTLRICTLLHETSHFVHDMSLGACMEMDYLTDSGLAALLNIIQMLPKEKSLVCPIFKTENFNELIQISIIKEPLLFLEERENLATVLLLSPRNLNDCVNSINPIFQKFIKDLNNVTGLAIMEGLVAAKTLVALRMRVKDEEDAKYLEEIKHQIPILPEKLPQIYKLTREIYDETIGKMLGIGISYQNDCWPHSQNGSARSISTEGFIYLSDIALHIPPFEYILYRIKEGLNTFNDFIPSLRYFKAINIILKKGCFPPIVDPKQPNQYYKTVFNFIANEAGWPSFEETNSAWGDKLKKYKELRREATDGYRHRLICKRNTDPSSIVYGDSFFACMKQFVPIFHLTPNGFKILGGSQIEDRNYFTPFEFYDLQPYDLMTRNMPLWKDLSGKDFVESLNSEFDNKLLFRQEMIYRIIAIELKNSLCYESHFNCPFSELNCSSKSESCKKITNLDKVPRTSCCIRTYLEKKNVDITNIKWNK